MKDEERIIDDFLEAFATVIAFAISLGVIATIIVGFIKLGIWIWSV